MDNITIKENWNYERREDGHYFTNDRGYFLLPLDLNNDPKERERYCHFSFFLKEEYQDVEVEEVEEYVKWFFIFLSKGHLKRSNLTYAYKFYREPDSLRITEGYVRYNFSTNKYSILGYLWESFMVTEVYLKEMGHAYDQPKTNYNTYYLSPKRILMEKFSIYYRSIEEGYLSGRSVNLSLEYKNFCIVLSKLLDKEQPTWFLAGLCLRDSENQEGFLEDLKEVFSFIQTAESVFTLLEYAVSVKQYEKELTELEKNKENLLNPDLHKEFICALDEEIRVTFDSVYLTEKTKEKFNLKKEDKGKELTWEINHVHLMHWLLEFGEEHTIKSEKTEEGTLVHIVTRFKEERPEGLIKLYNIVQDIQGTFSFSVKEDRKLNITFTE